MNAVESVRWKGRDATQQANGVIELITLISGGHFASFRLVGEAGRLGENVMWEPPWQTYDQLAGLSQEQLRRTDPHSKISSWPDTAGIVFAWITSASHPPRKPLRALACTARRRLRSGT